MVEKTVVKPNKPDFDSIPTDNKIPSDFDEWYREK